jgi:hypothetical protein
MRILRYLLLAPTLLFVAPLAKAQLSLYGSINATKYGYATTAPGTGTYEPGTGTYSFYKDTFGLEGGGTYLFHTASRLKAGVDLRDIYSPGVLGGDAGFASLRIAFVPRTHALSPYFQLGGGFITMQYPSSCVSSLSGTFCSSGRNRLTSGAADFLFGLNIRTHSPWSIRAIEFGGYAGTNVQLSSVGAGVVYTFRSRSQPTP